MKKSQIQQAIDKLEAEIAERQHLVEMLKTYTVAAKPKRERKAKVSAPVSTRSLSETH